ncbi:Actin-related protein 2/3 complex subunit 3 [Paramyrothecium foliicola]|nr:Actin-related protein 2/3 complex subunit 3 [Paramyrothecium foliicola]
MTPAYNSVFNEDPNVPRLIGNFPLLPLRTKTRGPAYTLPLPNPPLPLFESPDPDSESYDILDEVLSLFRANTFFRNFEIQGNADRLLIYGIWFVSDCLSKIKPTAPSRDATKDVMNLALDLNFAIPGDPAWPLNQGEQTTNLEFDAQMYEPPRDRQDAEQLRQYLAQVRQELATRLLARVYEEDETKPSKWWLSFTKRKFMGKSL